MAVPPLEEHLEDSGHPAKDGLHTPPALGTDPFILLPHHTRQLPDQAEQRVSGHPLMNVVWGKQYTTFGYAEGREGKQGVRKLFLKFSWLCLASQASPHSSTSWRTFRIRDCTPKFFRRQAMTRNPISLYTRAGSLGWGKDQVEIPPSSEDLSVRE